MLLFSYYSPVTKKRGSKIAHLLYYSNAVPEKPLSLRPQQTPNYPIIVIRPTVVHLWVLVEDTPLGGHFFLTQTETGTKDTMENDSQRIEGARNEKKWRNVSM